MQAVDPSKHSLQTSSHPCPAPPPATWPHWLHCLSSSLDSTPLFLPTWPRPLFPLCVWQCRVITASKKMVLPGYLLSSPASPTSQDSCECSPEPLLFLHMRTHARMHHTQTQLFLGQPCTHTSAGDQGSLPARRLYLDWAEDLGSLSCCLQGPA